MPKYSEYKTAVSEKDLVKTPEKGLLEDEFKRGLAVVVATICENKDIPIPTSNRESIGLINELLETHWSAESIIQQGKRYIESTIVVKRPDDITDEQYMLAVSAKQQEYKKSLIKLVGYLVIRRKKEMTMAEVRNMKTYSFSGDQSNMKEVEQNYFVKILHLPPLNDELRLVIHHSESADKVRDVVSEIEKIWLTLRYNQQRNKQVVTVFLYGSHEKERIRAYAKMKNNPLFQIDMGSANFKEVSRHEAVHACMSIESGRTYDQDFKEGIAVRLTMAFDPKEVYVNDPRNLVGYQEIKNGSLAKTGSIAGSHTEMLEQASMQKDGLNSREYGYVYGYYFMDELLKSKENREYSEQAGRNGADPYGLIKNIASSLNRLGFQRKYDHRVQHRRNRDIMRAVLEENGVDADSIFRGVAVQMQQIRHGS